MKKFLLLFIIASSVLFAGKPECSESEIETALVWTNTASCHFDRMEYNYVGLEEGIEKRISGTISTGFQEEDATIKSDVANENSGATPSDSNSPVTQILTLKGSAVNGFYRLRPFFQKRLLQMGVEYKSKYNQKLIVQSAFRSPEHQAKLFKKAVAKYGTEAKARKHVAPPGRSKHNQGLAVDVNMDGNQGNKLASSGLLTKYDCWRPMSWENWHIEPEETRAMRSGASSPSILDNNVSTTVGVNTQMYNLNQEEMTRHYSVLEMESRYAQELTLMTTEMLLARNRVLQKNSIEDYAKELFNTIQKEK